VDDLAADVRRQVRRRANCIAPGFIITDMTDKLPDEVKEGWYKQIPLRRGGTPEDVAKVALFLSSVS